MHSEDPLYVVAVLDAAIAEAAANPVSARAENTTAPVLATSLKYISSWSFLVVLEVMDNPE
jgi:hypothetical protein